jgi:uncharacterized OB-fold protein
MSPAAFECTSCGVRVFPRRYFCRGCGAGQWREVDAGEGTIDETTLVRHRAGAGARPPTLLASVITCAGPAVVAKLEAPAARGAPVQLRLEADGAIVASPRPARPPHAARQSSGGSGARS